MGDEDDLDHSTEGAVRKLLDGQVDPGGLKEIWRRDDNNAAIDEDVFYFELRLLHILNVTFKATESKTVLKAAKKLIGSPGQVLHVPKEHKYFPYHKAMMRHGRFLTPKEYYELLSKFDALEEIYIEATKAGDKAVRDQVLSVIEQEIPNKAVVLARSEGYPYSRVKKELNELNGVVDRPIKAVDFLDYVSSKVNGLVPVRECLFQLDKDLQSVDQLLARQEWTRTPETRERLIRTLLGIDKPTLFTKENTLFPVNYIIAHTETFPIDILARATTKIKCMGDCSVCQYFVMGLVRQVRQLGRII